MQADVVELPVRDGSIFVVTSQLTLIKIPYSG